MRRGWNSQGNPKSGEGQSLSTVPDTWLCGLGLTASGDRELTASQGCVTVGYSEVTPLWEGAVLWLGQPVQFLPHRLLGCLTPAVCVAPCISATSRAETMGGHRVQSTE